MGVAGDVALIMVAAFVGGIAGRTTGWRRISEQTAAIVLAFRIAIRIRGQISRLEQLIRGEGVKGS